MLHCCVCRQVWRILNYVFQKARGNVCVFVCVQIYMLYSNQLLYKRCHESLHVLVGFQNPIYVLMCTMHIGSASMGLIVCIYPYYTVCTRL